MSGTWAGSWWRATLAVRWRTWGLWLTETTRLGLGWSSASNKVLLLIRWDKYIKWTAGQLLYLCHRLDYHWYMGHLQGGDGSLGQFRSCLQILLSFCSRLTSCCLPGCHCKYWRIASLSMLENTLFYVCFYYFADTYKVFEYTFISDHSLKQ